MLENMKLNDFNKDFQTLFFFFDAHGVGITSRRGWLIIGGDDTNRFFARGVNKYT